MDDSKAQLKLKPVEGLQLRTRAQGLYERGAATARQAAGAICGVQAQDHLAMQLAVRARSSSVSVADVDDGLARGEIVRAWCMRGTLHLLPMEDLAWILRLVGPQVIRSSAKRRDQLGLTDELLAHGRAVLRRVLDDERELTRAEIVDELHAEGLNLEGQAVYHFLRHAALEGVIYIGPDKDGEPAYRLLSPEAMAPPVDQELATKRLLLRYLSAYAPARLDDFVSWSGLVRSKASQAWEDTTQETTQVAVGGQIARVPRHFEEWLDQAFEPCIRLLGAYDPYLLGYRSRDLIVAAPHAKKVHPGGGYLRPVLLVDGRAAGTWQLKRGRRVRLKVQLFERLKTDVWAALESEAADLLAFLGMPQDVAIESG